MGPAAGGDQGPGPGRGDVAAERGDRPARGTAGGRLRPCAEDRSSGGTARRAPRDWLTSEEWERFFAKSCRPDAILQSQAKEFAALFREGALSDVQMRQFSDRLQAMTNIQAACERLSSTPTPFTYTLLLHRTAWMFCLLLPFGLVGTLGAATPVATLILAYAFFGLDALGEELEEPFGRAQNAVPIDALVRVIEIATMETLDLPDVPSPLEPHDYVLL